MNKHEDRLLRQWGLMGDHLRGVIRNAIDAIDAELGADYARANPALISACVASVASDHHAASVAGALGDIASEISTSGEVGLDICKALWALSENARSDHPLQRSSLDGIENALREIADALPGAVVEPRVE
jgi:hypothetical protein